MTIDTTSALRALAISMRYAAERLDTRFGIHRSVVEQWAAELESLTADAADGVRVPREITARVTHEGRFPPMVRIRRVLSLLARHANESAAVGNDRTAGDLDSVSSFIREVFADYLDSRPHALQAHAQRAQQADANAATPPTGGEHE